MTSRPGRIREEIAIDSPRPRTIEVMTSGRFVDTKRRCLAVVRDESLKAIGGNDLRAAPQA